MPTNGNLRRGNETPGPHMQPDCVEEALSTSFPAEESELEGWVKKVAMALHVLEREWSDKRDQLETVHLLQALRRAQNETPFYVEREDEGEVKLMPTLSKLRQSADSQVAELARTAFESFCAMTHPECFPLVVQEVGRKRTHAKTLTE